LRAATVRSQNAAGTPSRAQSALYDNVRTSVKRIVKEVHHQPEKGALCELLKTNSLYDTETFCARVPMDLSKIKVLRGQTSPIAIESVIGPDAMPFVSEPRKFIPRSQSEINRHSQHHPPPIPYNDPALNNPRFKLTFIRHLFSVGLLTFRFKVLACLGFFTVGKKDGSQRLIGDARSANWLHRRAPYSPLAAAGAIANARFPRSDGSDPEGAGVDFQDGFYQFGFDRMAAYFGIDMRVRAGDFGVKRVFDDELGRWVPVTSDTWV